MSQLQATFFQALTTILRDTSLCKRRRIRRLPDTRMQKFVLGWSLAMPKKLPRSTGVPTQPDFGCVGWSGLLAATDRVPIAPAQMGWQALAQLRRNAADPHLTFVPLPPRRRRRAFPSRIAVAMAHSSFCNKEIPLTAVTGNNLL
jgi:hypothetical protein